MSQQKRIVRYLMGELSDPEQQKIEEQYFADPDFLQEVHAVCDDLMDDYLNGEMSPRDRVRFEQRLPAIPYWSEKVATNRAFLHFVNAAAPAQPPPQKRWNLAGLSARPFFPFAFAPAFAAVAVLGILLGGFWYLVKSRPTDNQVAQITPAPLPALQPSLTPVPKATALPVVAQAKSAVTVKSSPRAAALPIVASLLLSHDVTRGAANSPGLSLPAKPGFVLLQVELPNNNPHRYQVVLQTRQGQSLKIWHNLVATRLQSVAIIELKVPVKLLATGEYAVKLSPTTDTTYQYQFRVQHDS